MEMLGLLFLGFSGLGIWTGVTLMRKSTKNDDIKEILRDIGTNIFKLIDVFMILFENFKNLLMMLNYARKDEKHILVENGDKEKRELSSPKLINIQNQDEKNVA